MAYARACAFHEGDVSAVKKIPVVLKGVVGALGGGVVGWVAYWLLEPCVGGTCPILCRPYRSIAAGVILGAIIGAAARMPRKKEA